MEKTNDHKNMQVPLAKIIFFVYEGMNF